MGLHMGQELVKSAMNMIHTLHNVYVHCLIYGWGVVVFPWRPWSVWPKEQNSTNANVTSMEIMLSLIYVTVT